MSLLIIIFGALTLLAGIIIIINPETIFGVFKKHIENPWLHILAVVVRLVLGALLVYLSDISRFPLAIEIIGWLSIVAALFFAVIGRDNFIKIINWALSLTKPLGRIGGILAAFFGGFLVYAFV
ncbi:MAG: hypothetical protein OQL16_08435 [Gammaproteobacteria bacterium]|nr:hypothetical protein [Gammaproteobacteria bacterium]